MIVFDASSLVSATFGAGRVPDRAIRHAFATDTVAVSDVVLAELVDVLFRKRIAHLVNPQQRLSLLALMNDFGKFVTPTQRVSDCRDAKDDKYLELALAANATTIVSSDNDLLVLHPWRGIRIVLPAIYLAQAG